LPANDIPQDEDAVIDIIQVVIQITLLEHQLPGSHTGSAARRAGLGREAAARREGVASHAQKHGPDATGQA
jgi:hypothetical protein